MQHNRYFDDQVQSLAFIRNNLRATVGVLEPGEYRFETAAAERMTVVSGELQVRSDGGDWRHYAGGTSFEIAAHSAFDVRPVGGPAAYLCEFLQSAAS